jgi:hypothetical protein
MAQIELSIGDLMNLEAELNGFTDPDTGERKIEGFLKEKISLVTKYHLSKLSEDLKKERQILETLRDDLVKENGEQKEDGRVSIDMFLDEEKMIINPKFIEIQQKYMELLNQTKTIEYVPISLSILENVTSQHNYTMLYKLIES